MNLFGFTIQKVKDAETGKKSVVERVELEVQKASLLGRVKELEAENKVLCTDKPLIDAKIGDPSPVDTEQRKLYVAQVAGLHKEILEPKLKKMISTAHSILENENNSRDADLALKGAIYSFWEIIRWGEKMVNEQLGNQALGVAPPEDIN